MPEPFVSADPDWISRLQIVMDGEPGFRWTLKSTGGRLVLKLVQGNGAIHRFVGALVTAPAEPPIDVDFIDRLGLHLERHAEVHSTGYGASPANVALTVNREDGSVYRLTVERVS